MRIYFRPRKTLAKVCLASVLFLGAQSCSQYALEWEHELAGIDPLEGKTLGIAEVLVPLPFVETRRLLLGYLRDRRRYERSFFSALQTDRFFVLQPWVRDTSLRYIFIEAGARHRHLSDWKAQWTLEPAGPKTTRVSVDVLEVIFLGPLKSVQRPEPQNIVGDKVRNSDWFETPLDKIRALTELRRFWMENFLGTELPKNLRGLILRDPEAYPPLGLAIASRKTNRSVRERSF